jgi:choice-of-anchor B domain-containing protein
MKQILTFSALFFGFLFANSQKNIQLLGHYTYPNGVSCSNLTGYTDTAGNEYALVGTTQGLSIIDIHNPTSPVELFLVPGATGQGGMWREVREYKGFAYVTTEQSSGLVIVNLNYLPDSIGYHTITPGNMKTSHTIFIDEHGIAYVNGTDKDQLFLDLNANPWNPPVIGKFSNNYVHDCFVRNDTMWLSCINDGITKVVDATNKTLADAPANTLASWATPGNFSHNCWLSDDSKYLFTTDEKPNSYLTCYDVTDLNNVTETDRTQVNPGSNTIIHNTYYLNDYCVTSYYTYGIAIHDVSRKNNLVEVGNFDTSPAYSGDGFNGAWGVWPYLPSGNIIVSDIETGLWILKPTYKRACYIEGIVKDSICGTNINNVMVEIVQTSVKDFSNFLGKYSFGTPDSGTYSIRFSKNGYQTKILAGVHLQNGLLTTLNVELLPVSTSKLVIKTIDAVSGNDLPFVRVLIQDTTGNTYQEIATNNNAYYSFCDFIQGKYNFYAGRWGYVTGKVTKNINTLTDTITLSLNKGYYDDFIMDYGWTVSSTATSGDWERGVPVETKYNNLVSNTGADVVNDFGKECFVTGNNGGQAGDDDVDNGYTILRSPLFDLTSYQNPYLSYYRWFFNDGGQGTAPNDSLIISVTNGPDSVVIEAINATNQPQSQWLFHRIRLGDYIQPTANMRIYYRVQDYNPGHLVEAAIDKFEVLDSVEETEVKEVIPPTIALHTFPNPVTDDLYVSIHSNVPGYVYMDIIDALGRSVYNERVQDGMTTVPTGKWSKGVYFVKVCHSQGTSTIHRLLKQ